MFQNILPQDVQGMGNTGVYSGGGNLDPQGAMWLRRSLQAGTQNPGFGAGGTMQVQSLHKYMLNLSFTQRSLVAFRRTAKMDAISTLHEFDLVRDYGGEGGAFVNPGEAPAVQNSDQLRRSVPIKYMATQREVVDPLRLVKQAHQDPIVQKTTHAAMWLMEKMERALFNGNSAVVPQEWDGWAAQLFADPEFVENNTKDMRGRHITEDDVEDAARIIVESYGVPEELYLTPNMLSALTKEYYTRQRYGAPSGSASTIGFQAKDQQTSAGLVDFIPDVHIRPGRRKGVVTPPKVATYPLAPPPPATFSGTAPAPIANDPGKFGVNDAGTYRYWATALNRFGESAPTQIAGDLTFAAGESSTLTVTPASSSTTGFAIYRGKKGGNSIDDAQLITRIDISGKYLEQNFLLPGHGFAYLMQNDSSNKYIAMLTPMIKVPLSRTALSTRWAQAIYAHPVLPSTLRNFIWYNVPDTKTIQI